MRTTELAIAAALVFVAHAAAANPFTRLWVFGDSTVDTGWYQIPPFSGEPNFDAYLAPTSPHGKTGAEKWDIGRPTSSPGPMSVGVLGYILGVSAHPHNRLDDHGERGTNYATSGARNQEFNAVGSGLFPNAIPTQRQVDHYLGDHNPTGRALYVVSSGGNDISTALNANSGMCTTAAQTDVQTAAISLANTIKTLQDNNAQYIIVANQPESFGDTMDVKTCRSIYDTALMSELNALGVRYAWGDVNGVRLQIEGAPPAASTNITSAWALLCSPTSPVSTPTNADVSEFADDEHWATGAMKVLGSYYFCLAKNTWSSVFAAQPAPNSPPIACHTFNASWS
jgi:phospholipase/lecithinase/hemolysin